MNMCKKETLWLFASALTMIAVPLYGEIRSALLTSVESNALIRLLEKNVPFSCEPFGVTPLEKMAASAPDPQRCRDAVGQWYASHPSEREFGARHLHVQQTYRFDRLHKGCVLYANGPESYSEMLLLHGLALVDPSFDDKEWNVRLRRAQQGGEAHKNGLHGTNIRDACFRKEE